MLAARHVPLLQSHEQRGSLWRSHPEALATYHHPDGRSSIRLAEGTDLWYQGGGAYQPSTFGFAGLATGGRRDLATLYDASADITVTNRIGIGAFYAYASGGAVTSIAYPARNTARFGYVEMLIRF